MCICLIHHLGIIKTTKKFCEIEACEKSKSFWRTKNKRMSLLSWKIQKPSWKGKAKQSTEKVIKGWKVLYNFL